MIYKIFGSQKFTIHSRLTSCLHWHLVPDQPGTDSGTVPGSGAGVYTANTIRVTMRIAAFCFCSMKMASNRVVALCQLLLSSRGTLSSSNSSQSSLRRRGCRTRRRLTFQRQLQLQEKAVLLKALTTAIAVGFVPRPRTVWTLQR